MIFSQIQMYIMGVMAIIMLVLGGVGYWYFKSTQATMAELNQELTATRIQIEQSNLIIEQMTDNQEQIKEGMTDLFITYQKTQADIETLRDKFKKDDRDFGFLALNKPTLVEKIVNKATGKAFRCMELRTGAEPSELEKVQYEETGNFTACSY